MIAHTAYILLGNYTRWPIPVVVGIKYYVVRRFRAQFWGQTKNVDDSIFGRQKAFNMPLLHLSVNHPHQSMRGIRSTNNVVRFRSINSAGGRCLASYACTTTTAPRQFVQLFDLKPNIISCVLKLFPSSSFPNRLLQCPQTTRMQSKQHVYTGKRPLVGRTAKTLDVSDIY